LLGEADKDTAPQLKFLPDLNRSIDSDSTCEIFCYFSIEPPEDFDFVGPIQLPNFMHDLCGIHSGTIPFDRSHPDFGNQRASLTTDARWDVHFLF
jgi:hypothetical protein